MNDLDEEDAQDKRDEETEERERQEWLAEFTARQAYYHSR